MYVHYSTLQDYVIVSLHFVSLGMITLNLLECGWCWCELVHPVPIVSLGIEPGYIVFPSPKNNV
jgi:hypothetical protein